VREQIRVTSMFGPEDYRLGQTHRSIRTFTNRCRQMPALTEMVW